MKIVVTGGAGFIGANLCRRFTTMGIEEIVVIDDLSTGFESNLSGLEVDLRVGSILDRDLLDDVVDGAHSVIHLAALLDFFLIFTAHPFISKRSCL